MPDGSMSAASDIDLAGLEGKTVRIYVDAAGIAHINPASEMYWQLAEISIPFAQAGEDANGNPTPPPPLDLSMLNIVTFASPV